jgi:hypothetical protein
MDLEAELIELKAALAKNEAALAENRRRTRRLSVTNVVLAVVVLAFGGATAAYAVTLAPANSVNTAAIIDRTIGTPDVKVGAIAGQTILDNSLTGADIGNNSLTGDDLVSNAIGSRELDWESFQAVSDSEEIVAGGTSMGNTATEVRAQCPAGAFAVGGGGYWDFPSGTLSGVRILGSSVLAEGRNGGGASQNLHAFVFCMP